MEETIAKERRGWWWKDGRTDPAIDVIIHLATALPSGMSRAIKTHDTKISNNAVSLNIHFGDSKFPYRGPGTRLTNVASRLICARHVSTSVKNHYNAFISRTSEIVNALFSFLERRADPIAPGFGPGAHRPSKCGLLIGGKFISPPRLSKRLGKMKIFSWSKG